MNNQKGFINILVVVLVLVVIGVAGYYVISQKENRPPTPMTQVTENLSQNDITKNSQNEVNQFPVTSPTPKSPTINNQPKPTQTITPKPTPAPTNPTPPPTTPSVSSKIDSCRTINTAGEYSVSGDITNTKSEPCIKIQNVNNATLDCQNHTITSKNENYNIYIKGSSNFKINNCKLVSSINTTAEQSSQHVLRIEDSKQGEINSSTVGGNYSSISGSSFVTVRNSTFSNELSVYKSNNVTIRDSKFSYGGAESITLQEGNNNFVISNFIDGLSDGVFRGFTGSVGADDGIVIKDESGDLIQGNTLQNFFDCAIENTGKMFDARIIGNKATNAGVCFLGGWYWSSVRGITVKDNIVSNMPSLFYFFRQYSLKSSEQYVYFQNNIFESNKLSNPKLDTGFSMASRMVFDGSAVPLQNHILGNNVLRNNDFTKTLGPLRVAPSNIIVDGGGNICSGAETEAKGGGDPIPFNCN